jgi:hypothetical protein
MRSATLVGSQGPEAPPSGRLRKEEKILVRERYREKKREREKKKKNFSLPPLDFVLRAFLY